MFVPASRIHRQQDLRRNACRRGVELELADGDAHAVGAQIPKPEDAPAIGDANHTDVLDWPVAEHFAHMALARDREIHAARAAEDVAEFQAGLADGRIVNDWEKARRVRHHRPVKQRLIMIEQVRQIDVTVEVGGLVTELHHHPPQLKVLAFRGVRNQPDQPEGLLFRLRVGG